MYSAFPNRKIRATCHSDRPHHAKGFCYTCYRSQYRKTSTLSRIGNKRRNDRYKLKYPKMVSRKHRLHRYGVTSDEFEGMLANQNWKCKICLITFPTEQDAFIDHDHSTEQVRDLLCRRCNAGIGFLKENEFTMLRAIAYLQHHGKIEADTPPIRFVDLPKRTKSKAAPHDTLPT